MALVEPSIERESRARIEQSGGYAERMKLVALR
jgi:hypothetical protein